MSLDGIHAVTGAFGYSGQRIARRLLAASRRVMTLTNSHGENPFGEEVETRPFEWDSPEKLAEKLHGVDVLYNTYWVRYNRPDFTLGDAARNSETLFRAAREAGVRRVVHISATNASADSPIEYYREKGRVERALRESGLSHAVLRPAILFGEPDILVNNLAWALRRTPVFGVFGDGRYRLQPIHVDDLAALAVEQGVRDENAVINAIGPETFTYRGLAEAVAGIIGKRRLIVAVPAAAAYAAARVAGWLVGDVTITRDEVRAMMSEMLYVDSPPTGRTKLTEWARERAATLGRSYENSLTRRPVREKAEA